MLLPIGLTVAGCFVVVCAAFYALQGRLVWFPAKELALTPRSFGVPFRDVALTTSDGVTLSAWFLPAKDSRGALLLCHGNAGNMGDRIDMAARLLRCGVSVLLFDYRGYGRSGGAPSEEGTYRDAEAAYDWLAHEHAAPQARLFAFGESLGGAVAIELARRRPLAGLITQSTFTSAPDLGAAFYPWLPVRLLARIRYASIEKVAQVRCPWLLLHSRSDELVPFAHAQRLVDAATAAAAATSGAGDAARAAPRLVEIVGGHNDGGFLASKEGEAAVTEFFDRVCGAR
jgi:fermentation-respiration switch protein FrsA (DUF1100 family)